MKGSLGSAGQNYESPHLVSEDLSVGGKCRSGRVLYEHEQRTGYGRELNFAYLWYGGTWLTR